MANNPFGPYDPYTGEVKEEYIQNTMSVGRLAMEAVNPINWAKWKYQYDPRAWGGGLFKLKGGMYSPFGANIKSFKDLFIGKDTIFDTFKSNRKTKGLVGTYNAIRETLEKRVGGETYLFSNTVSTAKNMAKVSNAFKYNARDVISNAFAGRLTPRKAMRVGKVLERKLSDTIISGSGKVSEQAIKDVFWDISKSEFVKDIGLTPLRFKVTAKGTYSKLAELASAKGVREAVAEAGWAGTKATALRLGMFAGKAFAMYGAVTTAWDMTKMVAEPVGRYIVENANALATEYGQRYSPEMGGKIAMGYMSSGAATERQRAIEAISRSYINGRSALGNEANFYHS